MSFGTNLQYLRKRAEMTQEDFAEKMGVSRQSVSKWESDGAFPEMEKLTQICSMFGCDLDSLIRGSVEEKLHTDQYGYDEHMNTFIRMITSGVALIFAGLTVMFLMNGLGVTESLGFLTFFAFIIVAVTLFILGGIDHGSFTKKHPEIKDFYTDEQRTAFDKRFPKLIASAVAMILIGVMWLIASDDIIGHTQENYEYLITAPFFIILTVAVPILVYAGMTKEKFDLDEYEKTYTNSDDSPAGRICGCIMLLATAVFLVWGLVFNGWGICWVVYPVGGVLCGIAGIIFGNKK